MRRVLTALTALLISACIGNSTSSSSPSSGLKNLDPNPLPPGKVVGTDACEGVSSPTPGQAPIRRLNRLEYSNTIRDLFHDETRPGDAFPGDEKVYGFSNNAMALSISPLLTRNYLDAAEAISARANLDDIVPCKPTKAADEPACGEQFIRSFGLKAFRRPLEADEVADLKKVFDTIRAAEGFEAGIRVTVQAMLQSAPFLYRYEDGGLDGVVKQPSQYEMAARLSYLLWSSTPDDILLTAASKGELATDEQLENQARRMLLDKRARDTVKTFHSEWLELDKFDATEKNDSFPQFAGLKASMKAEAEAFLDYVFWDDRNAAHIFDAPYMFLNQGLSQLYGVAGGTGTEVTRVETTDPHRAGILTQGMIASIFAKPYETHPVYRGKFVREQILCKPLPPPPPGVPQVTPPSPDATTRERFAQHSSDPQCASCHKLIDGVGLGMEDIDAIGQFRTTQNGKPIDASGELVQAGDANGKFYGVAEMSKKLAASETVKACVSMQWFRFAMGRGESNEDACALQRLSQDFAAHNYDLPELLVALTKLDAFRYRGAVPEIPKGDE